MTEKFTFGKDKVLCEDPFESSMFKEDMQAKILGYTPNAKILKKTAYPTRFDHIAVKKARESSEKRSQVKDRKDVSSSHPFIYFLLNSPGSQLHNVKATTPDSVHLRKVEGGVGESPINIKMNVINLFLRKSVPSQAVIKQTLPYST